MSLVQARKKRTTLYLSIAGLMVMVAAVSAISARDPSGVTLRVGMIMVTVGAGLWLPWRQLVPAVVLAWLVPNLGRSLIDDTALFNLNMILEFCGLAGVAFFTAIARQSLRDLEQESVFIGAGGGDIAGLNVETSIFNANQLRPALQAELARSRRFRRTFSLVLVDIDELRQKFDYRDEVLWKASLGATTRVLRETRHNVDRVFHYEDNGFAMILPEASEKDIVGLVKRLRRLARTMKPPEGEPGGPMPVHFGATFFPDCATTVDDLLLRAEVALRIAGGNSTRYQLDSAEASELPPLETLRRDRALSDALAAAAGAQVTQAPPPAVSNPVVAAAVGEAYAERARQAVNGSSTESHAGLAEAVNVAGVATPDSLSPTLSAAQVALNQPEPVHSVAPEAAAALPAAADQEPRDHPAMYPDDLQSLLEQMDQTLGMIRSARHHAA